MKYRLATADERESYEGLYRLHAVIINQDDAPPMMVEDLRGSWRAPDPVWELMAPDGWHFGGGMGCHSTLGGSIKDIKDDASYYPLVRCDDPDSYCGCELSPN